MTSIMQSISDAAHAMAPSMFAQQKMEPAMSPSMRGKMIPSAPPMPTEEDLNKHYLIPMAPPMPTEDDLNKHYLSRDRTLENVTGAVQASIKYVTEVAEDVSQSLPSAQELKTKIPAAIGLGPKLDDNGIPIPPALPSREVMHKHYLIPVAPPMPTKQMLHKHYLIPKAPPMPTKEDLHKHYMSRDKTLENASNILRSAANVMSNFALNMKANLPTTADLGLTKPLDANGIPIPPALPTQEMLHKHYLIPVAPAMPTKEDFHGHYLIPMAPALPMREDMNKHYLSRDRTMENVQNTISSYANTAGEYAADLKDAVVNAPVFTTSRSIPAPPPLPTKESTHKHYLAMSQNERAIVDNLYNGEQSTASPMFSFNKVRRLANTATSAASSLMSKLSYPAADSMSSQGSIPVPPPLPTQEMLHKHYLIPLAPPMPRSADMNKHYMSRDKTVERAGSALSHALEFITEVATEVKDYVMETPIDQIKTDAREIMNPTALDAEGIPVPPALPTQEMLHKHYLIPMAPPMPTKESFNKHYMSRDKTLENAGNSILSAVHLAEEIVVDGAVAAKDAVVDGAVAAKNAVVENALGTRDLVVDGAESASQGLSNAMSAAANSASATKDAVVDGAVAAKDAVVDSAVAAKDAVVDGAVQLKEKVLPTPQKQAVGLKYPRSEVISESPILKHKSAGSRRIVARNDYNGFKPLLASAQRI